MKYFDRDFFKFTLGFISILTLSLAMLFFVGQYSEQGETVASQKASTR